MANHSTVTVPDVKNLAQSAAEAKLKEAGLKPDRVTRTSSGSVPSGSVVETSPAAGTIVQSGSEVGLNVSSGPPVSVPDLKNLAQSAAEAKLKEAGLKPERVTRVSSGSVPSGSVVGTSPAAGTIVQSGSDVALYVSSGPPINVPDLVGLTRAAAVAKLKEAGLTVGAVKMRLSDSVPVGGVSRTDPAEGTPVDRATSIAMDISRGSRDFWLEVLPNILFGFLGLFVLVLISYIVAWDTNHDFLTKIANKEVARGLITFLIAFATVGIGVILAISTIIPVEDGESDKRFDRGKQVLSILIGVLGTIVGFYFGAAVEQGTSAPKVITTTLPDGVLNQAYPATPLQSVGLTTPLTWKVSPTLPAGLVLDASTGTISGTPTVVSAKAPYTFTVTDSAKPAVSPITELTLEVKK